MKVKYGSVVQFKHRAVPGGKAIGRVISIGAWWAHVVTDLGQLCVISHWDVC